MREDVSFLTGKRNTFHAADYVLFAGMLIVSAAIGIFYAIKDRNKTNLKEFLMAGGNMGAIPVALSLLASFMSAITLLGTPAEMYTYGTMYWWIGLSYFFVIFGAAHVYVPIFYGLNITSVYEYLNIRFSKGVRTCGSLAFCVQMMLYMAIVLYAPSLALNAVTGFTLWGSVAAVALVCTFYTTLGGMKAVLWTDCFQVFMMIAGLLAVLIQGSIEVGGFSEAWRIAEENQRIWFTDFNPDPKVRHSFWTLVIGSSFTWVAIYGTNQAQVQRTGTCATLRKAQIALWINFPGLCIILYLCCLIGIVLYAFYSTCDPKSFGLVTASDQLLPLFVMDILGKYPGIPGLFVACLFSGALSTISSGLNSLSAVILDDFILAFCVKSLSERQATWTSRIIAIVLGVLCLGLSWVASKLGSVLQAALSLFGMIGGPLLGLFTLGMIFPWANKWGAYSGFFTSLVLVFWIGIGAQFHKSPVRPTPPAISTIGCNWNVSDIVRDTMATDFYSSVNGNYTTSAMPPATASSSLDDLYALSYLWYSATAVLTCVAVGLLVSFATGPTDPRSLDARLICPLADVLFPFLPEAIRKPLRFGINHKDKHNIRATSPNSQSQNVIADDRPNPHHVNPHDNPAFIVDVDGPRKRSMKKHVNGIQPIWSTEDTGHNLVSRPPLHKSLSDDNDVSDDKYITTF